MQPVCDLVGGTDTAGDLMPPRVALPTLEPDAASRGRGDLCHEPGEQAALRWASQLPSVRTSLSRERSSLLSPGSSQPPHQGVKPRPNLTQSSRAQHSGFKLRLERSTLGPRCCRMGCLAVPWESGQSTLEPASSQPGRGRPRRRSVGWCPGSPRRASEHVGRSSSLPARSQCEASTTLTTAASWEGGTRGVPGGAAAEGPGSWLRGQVEDHTTAWSAPGGHLTQPPFPSETTACVLVPASVGRASRGAGALWAERGRVVTR